MNHLQLQKTTWKIKTAFQMGPDEGMPFRLFLFSNLEISQPIRV
jgi:hypothetical protein